MRVCIFSAAALIALLIFVYPWKWLLRKGAAVKLKSLRYSEGTAREMCQLPKTHLCSEGRMNSVLTSRKVPARSPQRPGATAGLPPARRSDWHDGLRGAGAK